MNAQLDLEPCSDRSRHPAGARLLILVVGAFLGCGSPDQPTRALVVGKVTYQGKPVTGGTITFVADDPESTRSAPIMIDGTYRHGNVAVGKLRVTIDTRAVKELEPKFKGKIPAKAPRYMAIPEKYTDPDTSELRCTIKPSIENKVDFDLE